MLQQISLATEGLDDQAVALKLCAKLSIPVKASCQAAGKSRLEPKLPAYNQAAALGSWLQLRDLDFDTACPGTLCENLVINKSRNLVLRTPVRSIESVLLADRESMAGFFQISKSLIPANPDHLDHPKHDLVNLARRSRNRRVREAMVRPVGMSTPVGPAYTATIIEFVIKNGDPQQASLASASLRRCFEALRRLYEPRSIREASRHA
jgi:hypothetical protein